MATTLLDHDMTLEILKRAMNKEMVAAAAPLIAKALVDIEMVMRKKLGSMVVAYLDTCIEIDRMGQDLRIIVRHEHKEAKDDTS